MARVKEDDLRNLEQSAVFVLTHFVAPPEFVSVSKWEHEKGTKYTLAQKSALKHWFHAHLAYPYPTEHEKRQLAASTQLSILQLNNWFSNERRRNARYLQMQRRKKVSLLF